MLDEGLKDDAFKNINKLVKERRKVFEKKGVKVSKAKKAEIKKIKDTIKKPDKHDWNAFIPLSVLSLLTQFNVFAMIRI